MGGRGAKSSIGKTYNRLYPMYKNTIENIVNSNDITDNDRKMYENSNGQVNYSGEITFNLPDGKYKLISKLKKGKEQEYKNENIEYTLKKGSKVLIKDATKNNIRNSLSKMIVKVYGEGVVLKDGNREKNKTQHRYI